jgi:L-aspartate oxidase
MHKINTLAYIIIKSATLRKESRGLHYTTDYPHKNNQEIKDTTF